MILRTDTPLHRLRMLDVFLLTKLATSRLSLNEVINQWNYKVEQKAIADTHACFSKNQLAFINRLQ